MKKYTKKYIAQLKRYSELTKLTREYIKAKHYVAKVIYRGKINALLESTMFYFCQSKGTIKHSDLIDKDKTHGDDE